MRLFIETLIHLLEEQRMSQTELVDRCNKNGAKDGLQISKGAVSNYKQGRFPEPSYAALLIRNASRDPVKRNELTAAYLRDIQEELGVGHGEIDVVNLRTKKVNELQALPEILRKQLAVLGQAAVKVGEFRHMVDKLSKLAKYHLNPPAPKVPVRGLRKSSRRKRG